MKANVSWIPLAVALIAVAAACGGEEAGGGRGGPGGGGPGGGMAPFGDGGGSSAAVPVEVTTVTRRTISSFIETNGTLEAEVEVDLVARVSAPIVSLEVEEGDLVSRGQLLARLDDTELRVQTELAKVAVAETKQAFDRSEKLHRDGLVSPEEYERAVSAHDSARAQLKANEIQLGFTEIRAPFAGRIVRRYVDPAQQVSVNTALYRLSDFDPLLCPIQIPERDLPRVRLNQAAWLSVEAAPDERFAAHVLRISPIVEAATGTVKVTLEVRHGDVLRPGMFARVFVETETRDNALVLPKAALSLESIGDTVYVAADGVAARREVELGYRQGDLVEVLNGVREGELVVVVGQDGLSDGTPLQILAGAGDAVAGREGGEAAAGADATARADGAGRGPGGERGGRPDFADMSEQQLEQVKERMRSKGMTEEQIEERLKRFRQTSAQGE